MTRAFNFQFDEECLRLFSCNLNWLYYLFIIFGIPVKICSTTTISVLCISLLTKSTGKLRTTFLIRHRAVNNCVSSQTLPHSGCMYFLLRTVSVYLGTTHVHDADHNSVKAQQGLCQETSHKGRNRRVLIA